jgi:hypothetical protein
MKLMETELELKILGTLKIASVALQTSVLRAMLSAGTVTEDKKLRDNP